MNGVWKTGHTHLKTETERLNLTSSDQMKKIVPKCIMDVNQTYYDQLAIYTNIESLFYTHETNIMLCQLYPSFKNYKKKNPTETWTLSFTIHTNDLNWIKTWM